MIKVQNIETGSVINVLNVVVENGQIISEARRPHKGARFYSAYPMMVAAGESEDGRDLHDRHVDPAEADLPRHARAADE